MSKSLHTVTLTGRLADTSVAKTQQAKDVKYFSSANGLVKVVRMKNIAKASKERIRLHTKNGIYTLYKHSSQNYYAGTTPTGIKLQVTLKKIVGELRYWAEI